MSLCLVGIWLAVVCHEFEKPNRAADLEKMALEIHRAHADDGTQSRYAFEQDPAFLAWAYYLWCATGKGTWKEELSSWIIADHGRHFFHRWPHSHKAFQETWRGAIPHGTWANMHVHPTNAIPRPSGEQGNTRRGSDIQFARENGLLVYTVHRDGIYRYDPETDKITLVHGGVVQGRISRWWQDSVDMELVALFNEQAERYTKNYQDLWRIGSEWNDLRKARKSLEKKKTGKRLSKAEKKKLLARNKEEIMKVRGEYLALVQRLDAQKSSFLESVAAIQHDPEMGGVQVVQTFPH
ncbi:hypothetical protein SCOR_15515 [Sulfidibacter corallicola]|uniref:Uncharacterized protein n=1 Tax=Sulfidibacter corallicola TaxID=2818388 RepID=A0A8A4U5V3_SULCO|nr:hypothetical protein [Sulfidibacter corallicola]QTD54125.1 hypothetical protein J3U87_16895 [Sulfidibacter corallicola]